MKIKNLWRIYTIVISLAIITTLFATAVFINSASADHNTLDNLITFVVTILSMLIAVLAYHISVKTYISIDAVNAMSRMDGNVMENENYRTGILSIIQHFDAPKREDASEQIIGHLENLFRGNTINSGAKLADNIQEMIDVIVLFSFIIKRKHKGEKNNDAHNNYIIDRVEKLIKNIETKVTKFEQLSEGSCILIRESVKLLKAVYIYQCYESGYQSHANITLLIDVRGPMLKNAISKTIYYNYIGLLYMSKAMQTINNYLFQTYKINYDALSIDATKLLKQMPQSQEKELATIYLNEAISDFKKAVQTISDELMWNAFIQYNMARAQYLLTILSHSNDLTWNKTLKTSIDYRSKLMVLLNDILGENEKTYFQRAFSDQLKMARLMQIRLKIASDIAIEPNLQLPDIGCDEFARLKNIYTDILDHLQTAD